MPRVDKQLSFNAFHILLIILISNIIIYPSWYFEHIVNDMYYVLNMEPLGFWFLMIHIIIAYIILTNLEIDIGFQANIKFNL
jgi:hypothetical protein